MSNFKDVTDDYNREEGGERHIRTLSDTCWISVLHRRTGFGNGIMEWETAINFLLPVEGRARKWNDRDCLIIAGDRRAELETMPESELRTWYAANIEGNRNMMETILHAVKEAK